MLFAQFIRALRNAEVRVSPAETLDALEIFSHVGIENKSLLKDALSMTLAKTREEKERFNETFERFFTAIAFNEAPKQTIMKDVDVESFVAGLNNELSDRLVQNISHLLSGRREELSLGVQQAAAESGLKDIHSLREKRSYVELLSAFLGLKELEEYIRKDTRTPEIRYLRQYLQTEVRNYVDDQYRIHVDATGRRSIVEAAINGNLGHVPPEYHEHIRVVIRKLAKRLNKERRRKKLTANVGVLDVKKTLRRNLAFDGCFFDLRWRKTNTETAKVFVICDVSNSVAKYARFLLLFLYELVDLLPQIRAFVFSNRLGEVTDVFSKSPTELAIEDTLFKWGKGNTDYGSAWTDFRNLCRKDLSKRATLIVLGDGRNNYYDPAITVFRELSSRVKQVFWLNPESREQWSDGDSEMSRYAPYCTRIEVCQKLSDIERFANRLISVSR